MAISAREAAVKTLSAFRKRGAWSEQFLGNLVSKESLPPREAALAARICFGVLQNMAYCDYYIDLYSSVPTGKMEPMVLDIMRVSAYQILLMSKIPESAAVNEGVELVKRFSNPKAAGLCNAVLRKIAQNARSLPQIMAKSEEERLSIRYSHPLWLVELLINDHGISEAEGILRCNNEIPPVTAQVNRLKTSAQAVLIRLEEDGVKAVSFLPDMLLLTGAGSIERLKAFAEGGIYIQDAASCMAVAAAGLEPGFTVLDACAAPGGKSFAAAVRMDGQGKIISCDIHEKKLGLISGGAGRLGIGIIETRAMDARRREDSFTGAFDAVLADAPCSGMGIIRKKPDIRYKDEKAIQNLPEVQKEIIENLAGYVNPGGVFLYSTCTILRRENEEVVRWFLEKNSDFALEPFELPLPSGGAGGGMITLLPHIHGTDGFFIAKLRKKK